MEASNRGGTKQTGPCKFRNRTVGVRKVEGN